MNSSYLVGLDIGTSGAKAVILERSGRLLAWAGQEYRILTPRPGWAEQDPQEWLLAATTCVREVVEQSGVDPRSIAGLALAGQMHTLVCLNDRGDPLRPAILWADQRSAPQVRALTARIGRQNLAEWTGNPLAAGFMLSSWAWLKENEPSTVTATRCLMLPKDYVRYRLTGAIGTEPSDASSTSLFDPHLKRWSAPILDLIQLSADKLPPVFPSSAVAGPLRPEMADACGLIAGTPVVFGGSDVSCQALAQGIIEPGSLSCTIGTGGQLFAPLNTPHHDPELRLHLFCHCVPETWHQEAAILSAGLALRWLRDQVFPGVEYAGLANLGSKADGALDGLFFLPFLAGERTPHMDPGLRAGFLGLSLHHGQANMVRAVMEGVVFALRQGLDLMQTLGTPLNRVISTGGATRHGLWLQLQANIFNRPVYISNAVEATARGAALLAGLGAGVYASPQEAIRTATGEPVQGALPDPDLVWRYAPAYREYVEWAQLVADHYRVEEIS